MPWLSVLEHNETQKLAVSSGKLRIPRVFEIINISITDYKCYQNILIRGNKSILIIRKD